MLNSLTTELNTPCNSGVPETHFCLFFQALGIPNTRDRAFFQALGMLSQRLLGWKIPKMKCFMWYLSNLRVPLLPGEEPTFPPYIKMGPAFLDNNGQRTRFNKPCSLCKMQFQAIQSITPNQDQLVICGHKCKLKTQGVWFEIY